jgi:hypothetical protein
MLPIFPALAPFMAQEVGRDVKIPTLVPSRAARTQALAALAAGPVTVSPILAVAVAVPVAKTVLREAMGAQESSLFDMSLKSLTHQEENSSYTFEY